MVGQNIIEFLDFSKNKSPIIIKIAFFGLAGVLVGFARKTSKNTSFYTMILHDSRPAKQKSRHISSITGLFDEKPAAKSRANSSVYEPAFRAIIC